MTADIQHLHKHIRKIGNIAYEKIIFEKALNKELEKLHHSHMNYLTYKNDVRTNWIRKELRKKFNKLIKERLDKEYLTRMAEEESKTEFLDIGLSYFVFYTIQKYDVIFQEMVEALLNDDLIIDW